MAFCVISEDGSESLISRALVYEVRMSVRNPLIGALLPVVETSKVVTNLVTKAEQEVSDILVDLQINFWVIRGY